MQIRDSNNIMAQLVTKYSKRKQFDYEGHKGANIGKNNHIGLSIRKGNLQNEN